MTTLFESFALFTPYLALVLRVWLGANFIIHARPKLGKGTQQTVQWIKGMGLPSAAAYSAISLELFGGIFLIVGFLVPIVSLLFSIDMIANSLMKRSKMNAAYIAQDKPTYELDVLYLLLSLVLIVLGSGAFSLDQLVGL